MDIHSQSHPDTLRVFWYIDGMNFSRVNNPNLDRLLKGGWEELNLEKWARIYVELHTYVMEQAPLHTRNRD